MSKEIKTFGDTKIENCKFNHCKNPSYQLM